MQLFLIFVLSKFRNRSQIPHSKDRVLFMLKKCLNNIFLQIWKKYINKLVFPEWAIHRIVQKWRMLNPKRWLWKERSTGFLDLFYGKSEVSVKTLLIFFYCGQVSRENCCKNGGYSFIIFLASKMKLTDGFMNFTWHKIMKPPHSVWKKKWNWRHAASPRPSVSFFFQTECGRFHNFSHVKSWNHSQFHFWAKKR